MSKSIWIRRRLPKPDDLNERDEVLVTTKDHIVKIAEYSEGGYFIDAARWCQSTEVIAWAKMPEAFREDK